MAIHIN